ncbi:stress response translation initiation inhibitor YciH [archaeon]|nr:stress response translation initiation inhibitor YciH [archaeon]|tara:strand:- start:499 stop:807 length:309 start_codon:yes stop_codon:yes gene_type:complete
MSGICPKCGLAEALCVCETIAKEEQQISVSTVKRAFGKLTTIVDGIDQKAIDLKDLSKKLKSKLACGGTAKNGVIELQGDHVQRVKTELVNLGFAGESIVTH